jgi:hypothetical protein
MIAPVRRDHAADGVEGVAIFSPCELYRYLLERTWNLDAPKLTFVLLNPSTADEKILDPTIEQCLRRARLGGFGRLRIVNLFAFRATKPADMLAAADPVGPANDDTLRQSIAEPHPDDRLVCAWGNHGNHQDRAARVLQQLRDGGHELHHLMLNKGGAPRHPLYVAQDQPLQTWQAV